MLTHMNRFYLAIVTIVLTLAATLTAQKAQASHGAGGNITYEWQSGSTYKIRCNFYRDCSGIVGYPTTLCYKSACGFASSIPWVVAAGPTSIVVPCPNQTTNCNGGSLPDYHEYILEATVTLPSQCSLWTFFTTLSTRNGSVNISNSANEYWYAEATLNNQIAQGNSSPVFTVRPVPFVCQNIPYTYNNGASDPNNDSMSFEMIMPRAQTACTGAPTTLIFTAGTPAYNLVTNPIQTNNTFNLSATTGQSTFTPPQLGAFQMTILVREWRNGVQIGSVMRDIQVLVRTCTSTQPVVTPVTSGSIGANVGVIPISACAGQLVYFCTRITSADTNAWLAVQSNNLAIAPGSTMTYTNIGTDTVLACFSWNTSLNDTGLRILTYSVKDTNCTSNGGIPVINTYSVPFFVNPATIASNDTTICTGGAAQLNVNGGGNFTWTALPGGSGAGSLSCTNCPNPIATPTATTSYVVSSGTTSHCLRSKDTVVVTIAPVPTFNAGPDTTTCINNSLQLNANVALPVGTYTIQWTPATFLSNPNIQNPIITPTSDISYSIKVIPGAAGACAMFDTLRVNVVMGYNITTPDTAICKGSSINVAGSGDARYHFAWTPTQGVTDPTIVNPTITPDTSKTYVITATFPGCRDSVLDFYVTVDPLPVVSVGPDKILCYGDTVHMGQTDVMPNWYMTTGPDYTYSWDPAGSFSPGGILHPTYTGFTTANVILIAKTKAAGCEGRDTAVYSVIPANFLTVSNDTSICPGDTAQLHVSGIYAGIRWIPETYITTLTDSMPRVSPPTTTVYSVIGTDMNSCLDTQMVQIRVNSEALISLPDSVTIFPSETYALSPGGNCLYFTWFPLNGLSNPNIGNPIASPEVNTRYFVNARTEAGCTVTDSIDVNVSLDSWIDVPNAFSPGSQPNSIFKIVRRGSATVKTFKVFNRWGAEMFSTTNVDQGWDGTFNGTPQPMGAYVYIVEAIGPNGRRFYKQGNVTLIR